MGVKKILADRPPDLVLSGVNRGQNVAEDVTYSGTIAGAWKARSGVPYRSLCRRPMAARSGGRRSNGTRRKPTRRPSSARISGRRNLLAPGGLVNVNFPACPASEVAGIDLTRQGRRNAELMRVEERRDGRGFPYFWLMFQRGAFEQVERTDLAALAANKIFIYAPPTDLTDHDLRLRFEEAFARR